MTIGTSEQMYNSSYSKKTNESGEDAVTSRPKPLWKLFDEIVENYSERIAVTFGDRQLTYRELNNQANSLAVRLRSLGVGVDSLIGVYVERSDKAVIALLAIVKAGGAYLPLDPAYPRERIAMILDDAQPIVVLTEQHLLDKMPQHDSPILCLDCEIETATEELEIIAPCAGPDNLVYVIYTSGSTGKPKGVMVTHANVARLLSATSKWFHFSENDVWALFHSIAFDFSVWEIWGCLLHGGRLVIVPFSVSRSPHDFYALLVKEKVSVLNQTPSAFYQLIAEDERHGSSELALRAIIFGGEALNYSMLKPWFAAHGDVTPRLVNMYGITETTVHVTYREVIAGDSTNQTPSLIGIPIPDLQLYLLDDNQRQVAVGTVGEIYVGGAGVARGYLNRPELSAERFIADRFSQINGARLYKSGDLARYLPDGELEYLGRGDAQVKIQGYRIELGEIEVALAGDSRIREARVVAHTDTTGTKRLVAYFTSREGAIVTARELSAYLSAKLPPWMMPSVYMPVLSFPLTPNGKVDYAALPEPTPGSKRTVQAEKIPIETEVEIECTSTERKIANVWCMVLGAKCAGLEDNFFDIGGTSLLLVKVHAQLQVTLNRKIPITDLFAYTTVRALSQKLDSSESHSELITTAREHAQKQQAAFARARAQRKTVL